MPKLVLLIIASCAACGGSDGAAPPDAGTGTDGSNLRDAAPPDVPWADVARTGGVIALDERDAFCRKLVSCRTDLTYATCRQAADDTATVQFAIPGCASDARLEAAIACTRVNDVCTGTACDAALNAWATSFASPACESDVYSVGTGDRFPVNASDSTCAGGIRADGGWCTHACSTPQQCAGTGTNGKNHFGAENTCAYDSLPGGYGCYPTCTSTRDCQAWFGETRRGVRMACKKFSDGSAPSPICVRVTDNRGVELP